MESFVWDLNPTIMTLGPLQLRYYGLFFGATLLLGYHFFQKRLMKYGFEKETAENYLIKAVISVIVGARLVHCLFYDPDYYLSNPLEILKIYKGGIASHGAAAGLFIVSMWFVHSYNKKRKIKNRKRKEKKSAPHMSFMHVGDSVVFAAATGAMFVRIGNFFNSEIVGRVAKSGFGVKFLRYPPDFETARRAAAGVCDSGDIQCLIDYWPVRHPSQLYEALGGLIVLLTLIIVDKKTADRKIPGLFSGLFLSIYFTFRFFIEFVKEYQTLESSMLTMGQYLSIPFVVTGVCFIIRSLIHNHEKSST